ncbi:RNA polymerase sigma factor [Jonesiaceae bacterium BS-20]|uniref:RNA polymerase sigma factor n=1 Tax=Jonesiaceae bacterium BS-20 TaxID=3120821 RepID=A0AAU7DUN8_9MICO
MKIPFEALVQEHGSTVLRVCRAVVGPIDARDAWSETFLSALQKYPELPANANVQAWLVTIAHRKALDIIRRSDRTVPVSEVPDTSLVQDANEFDVLDAAAVWQIVKLLPPRQRQVVAYRYLGGLSFQEIAEVVGGTAAAARRACSDGLANLRSRHIEELSNPSTFGGMQ